MIEYQDFTAVFIAETLLEGAQFDSGTSWSTLAITISSGVREECLLSSNFINHLQHIVHDRVVVVIRRKYAFDYCHGFTMRFLTSSNGGLVFVNSHQNPVFEPIHVVITRKLIRIDPPIHMMAPCDHPRPGWYAFRVSLENIVRPVTMTIPEGAHGVV